MKKLNSASLQLIVFIMMSASLAQGAPVCQQIFSKDGANQAKIELTLRSLAELRLRLDSAQAEGLRSTTITALHSDYAEKENDLVRHVLKTKSMTIPELRERLKEHLALVAAEKNAAEESRRQIREDEARRKEEQKKPLDEINNRGRIAIFNTIAPGTFTMKEKEITLTNPVIMMDTPVTQTIWAQVVELGKTLDPVPLKSRPNKIVNDLAPVTSVRYDEMTLWIRLLNELSAQHNQDLKKIFPGHQDGDTYRLPTSAEWEFVATNRGRVTEEYAFDWHASEQHAWFKENATSPQAVAQKLPFLVDEMHFYDLFGNVWEVTSDIAHPEGATGTNMLGTIFKDHIARGGAYDSKLSHLDTRTTLLFGNGISALNVGFRLVKDVKD